MKTPDLVDRSQSLAAIPVLNDFVRTETMPDGRMMVIVKLKSRLGFLSRFVPPVTEKRVKLDELGEFVFSLVDGRRNTKAIIDEFATRYLVNRREAQQSCIHFLKMLGSRGIISVVIK